MTTKPIAVPLDYEAIKPWLPKRSVPVPMKPDNWRPSDIDTFPYKDRCKRFILSEAEGEV